MSNCGTTGLIPDCLEAQNSTWTITYNVPRPPVVKHKYPSDTYWSETIGATRYTIESLKTITFYSTNNYRWQSFDYVTNYQVFDNGSGTRPDFRFYVVAQTTRYGEISSNLDPSTLREEPMSNSLATLKIYDCKNVLLKTEQRLAIPQVEVIPSKLYSEDAKTIKINPSQFSFKGIPKGLIVQNIVFDTDGKKGTTVEITPYPMIPLPPTGSGYVGRTRILELYSPKCSDIHPKICWECKPCKTCPEGTCLKCCDGNRICCYGSDGTVIGYADPECEKCDC